MNFLKLENASSLDLDLIEKYNKSRYVAKTEHLCHAPFNNMYFNVFGHVGACWNTFYESPRWPEKSIKEIWTGEFFEKLRTNIKACNLSQNCSVCDGNIRNGNFLGTLAQAYDNAFPLTVYPSIMEMELSNRCNLECVMCKGELSSAIRKNRDKLPAIESPYNDDFVEELKEFIPHLREMRFNGGEPFLQEICYKIWDQVAILNPDVEITVATNGSVLNTRVKELLEKCKFRINVSVDALDRDNYETIRKNANYDRLMENIEYFGEYCRQNNRIFSIMINPMRQNWWEMPAFVHWCNEKNYHLWFNTVVDPSHCSLMTWDEKSLRMAYEKLSENQSFKVNRDPQFMHIHQSNITKYENLVQNMIRVWWHQKRE